MSASEESLQSILSKGEPSQPKVEPAKEATPPVAETKVDPAPKAETTAESRARDESGKFVKAEEKAATPPEKVQEPSKEKPRADVAAIMDERRKRQELERKLQELTKAQSGKPPSVFEDEDRAISTRVDAGTQQLREMLFKMSVKAARGAYKEGFSEAEQAFMDAAERDPKLYDGLRTSDDPGEFIYSVGLQIKELADVGGDFLKYREKITSQSREELTALKTQYDALKTELESLKSAQADLANVPRSLNNQTSAASPKTGDGDAEDIKTIVRFGQRTT